MMGSCEHGSEHGSEHFDSVKRGESVDWMSVASIGFLRRIQLHEVSLGRVL